MNKKDTLNSLTDFFTSLSNEDRYFRFHRQISTDEIRKWIEVVYQNKENYVQEWIIVKDEGGEIKAVGSLCTVKKTNPIWAEVALVVKSEYRNEGLGKQILSDLEQSAIQKGILESIVSFVPENEPIKKLLTTLNYQFSFVKELNKYCGKKILKGI